MSKEIAPMATTLKQKKLPKKISKVEKIATRCNVMPSKIIKANHNRPLVNKDKKTEIPKPFEIKHYKFFPCGLSANTKNGLKYFLLCRGISGLWLSENKSPRFKNKQEAIAFAETNKDLSIKPW
jgi:hypothetical protein